MKTISAFLLSMLLLAPTGSSWAAAPGGVVAAKSSAVTASPVKRSLGAKIKAGWRGIGRFGQAASVTVVGGAAAFGMTQLGMTPVESAATIGGVLALGTGTMAIVAQRARKVWSSSLTAIKLKTLYDAQSKGTWNEVPAVLQTLEKASEENAKLAPSSKKAAKQQALQASFLNLGIVRAELALNGAPDSKQRLSGVTLPAWQSHLGDIDTKAQAQVTRESEGKLALALVDLNKEMQAERAVLVRHEAAVAQFEDRVPVMFGGKMAKEAAVTKQQLADLKSGELAGESELHGKLTTKMRGRVSDRIAGESAEFKQRRVRHGDLKQLREGVLGSALGEARGAESHISSAISDRQLEVFNEAEAMAHTHDTETYYENNETKTRTVDNSSGYRAMAAMYASSARSHMSSANDAMAKLSGHLRQLAGDATILSEKLNVPGHGGLTAASGGPGWASELFLPEAFNLFSNVFSMGNLSSAQSAVSQKVGALSSLHDEVSRRETGELSWLDKQIDEDLSRQMTAATP